MIKKTAAMAALSGMMVAGALSLSLRAQAQDSSGAATAHGADGECHGVNSCKGKGECGGKGHSCAGKNSCKGKGWVKMNKEDCAKKKRNLQG